jgi:uncharacterized protein
VQSFATFHELPIRAITPEGWLRRYLEIQRDGLTGHLESAGFPFNTEGWAAPLVAHQSGTGWWPYEQNAYWIDGMIRCGHLLNDAFLIEKAAYQIEYVLDRAERSDNGDGGYLGPAFMKDPAGNNRWPHTIFFRAWIAHYGATGDERLVDALHRHYLSSTPSDHSGDRNVTNIEPLLWAYAQTGDPALLSHALLAYEEYNRQSPAADTAMANLLSDKRATEHGVTYNEIGKLGALLYTATGEQAYLDAAVHAYKKIDRDAMLVDGIHSSTEGLKGKDPLDSHETCDIADYTWSAGTLLMATGDADYADKVERACFNAAPGAVRSDFKGLQYFSCPNQVIADKTSNHNLFYRGHSWMSYRPNPGTECCPGEVNRIMPNFAARMWMHDGKGGLVAAFYGPSRVTTPVGSSSDGGAQTVTIVEETDYPFSDRIDFQILSELPVTFTLHLRIPGWCSAAQLAVNGEPAGLSLHPGSFVPLTRTFHPNDRITLVLPMALALKRWPRGGISLERGPLAFSLRIEEAWEEDPDDPRSTPEFPAWNLYPASDWAYAPVLDDADLASTVEIVHKPVLAEPWMLDTAPIELRVPARRVKGWELERKKTIVQEIWSEGKLQQLEAHAGSREYFTFTPQLPDPATLPERLGEELETVTLVPYGCTRLRITIFPDGNKHSEESS